MSRKIIPPQPTPVSKDLIAVIGRFSLPHNAHIGLFEEALSIGKHLLIIIGSAYQSRSAKNPFSAPERERMIRGALPDTVQDRVHFAYMPDYYDQPYWVARTTEVIHAQRTRLGLDSCAILGHLKDQSSSYLKSFPIPFLSVENPSGLNATDLRSFYFSEHFNPQSASAIQDLVAPSVLQFLIGFTFHPDYPVLKAHFQQLQADLQNQQQPYFCLGSALVTCNDHVLLVGRKGPIGAGQIALPERFLQSDDASLEACAQRELYSSLNFGVIPGLLNSFFVTQRTFDAIGRSDRGRHLSTVFHYDLGSSRCPSVQPGVTHLWARWIARHDLASLRDQFFEDHYHIVEAMLGLPKDSV